MDWTERRLLLASVLSYFCAAAAVDESIQTTDVQAEFGESAMLECLLTKLNGFDQVTWKKIENSNGTTLATYSKLSGAKVVTQYQDLLNISIWGSNKTAITIYRTGVKDEGCYACVLNVFPVGAREQRVCLSLSGEVLVEKSHQVKLGDEITLRCYMRDTSNLTQVSWEKNGQNIGIYRSGKEKIEPQFQRMVHLSMESPFVSALTIWKAAKTDEGDYKCVFNIFPKGSTEGRTKLYVHSLSNHLRPVMILLTLPLISLLLWH